MKSPSIARKAANFLANATSAVSRIAFEFSSAVAKALAEEKADYNAAHKAGFRHHSKFTNQWDGGAGQASSYIAKRRIHAGRSSSIRKVQKLNRLKAYEAGEI